MHKILVAGIDTGVGKTVVSAILTVLFQADYWKPIQSGEEEISDTVLMKKWLSSTKHTIHPPTYSLKHRLSPHHAARLENISIKKDAFIFPQTKRHLIVEGAGGVLVPLTTKILTLDLFQAWGCAWVIVSKHYLGSINHTLLTIDALKRRHISLLGLIFNGAPNPDTEAAILEQSQLPLLGRVLPETHWNLNIFQTYAKQWYPHFSKLIP